ncbi:MAG: hypothetical protein IPL78_16840 [Chloroflexi bacterium]|nr:hypothetical protein [Chloroflexota bacterium]
MIDEVTLILKVEQAHAVFSTRSFEKKKKKKKKKKNYIEGSMALANPVVLRGMCQAQLDKPGRLIAVFVTGRRYCGELFFLALATGNLYVQSGSAAIDAGVDAGIISGFCGGRYGCLGAVCCWQQRVYIRVRPQPDNAAPLMMRFW